MSDTGFSAFGRIFSPRVGDWRQELRDLEREGVTYGEFVLDEEHGGPGIYRVNFSPCEIYEFVRGVVGWDQYLAGGFDAVTDRALAREAAASAAERREYDGNAEDPCPADFLGEDVESLVCGSRLDKMQRVRAADPRRDALEAVHRIASSLPTAVKSLTERGSNRPSFKLESERDLQDLLFFALRSTFEDVRREEWVPSTAGNAKRVDLLIPEARLVLEVKFIRDARHARVVADELKIDCESYHSHPACGTLIAIVWDPDRRIADPKALSRDLTGSRVKGNAAFEVAVQIV